jgi:hypothetical protein
MTRGGGGRGWEREKKDHWRSYRVSNISWECPDYLYGSGNKTPSATDCPLNASWDIDSQSEAIKEESTTRGGEGGGIEPGTCTGGTKTPPPTH